MSAFLLLVLFQPLIVAGVLALGLFAAAVCWLLPLALCVALCFTQAAAWVGLGFALLLTALTLPGFVLWSVLGLGYAVACWLLIEFSLGGPSKKTDGWRGGGADEL